MKKGVLVGPNTRLSVVFLCPNSDVFVMPIAIAPASSRRCTCAAVAGAMWFSKAFEPYVFRTPPSESDRSFRPIGTPKRRGSGPRWLFS